MKNNLARFSLFIASSVLLSACNMQMPSSLNPLSMPSLSLPGLGKSTASAQIPSLDFKNIVASVYQVEFSTAKLAAAENSSEDYFHRLPQAQLKDNQLAFMHPVIRYQNINAETRYLVMIEKVKFYDGYIQSCRACQSTADFLIYQKQGKGYRLLNAAMDQDAIPSSNGHLLLDFQQQLQANWQPFGQNAIGSAVKAEFSGAGGQRESAWYALMLPDQGQAKMRYVGHAGSDSQSYYADRPELANTVTSSLKVIANGSDNYPLEVTYIDANRPNKPTRQRFQYNAVQDEYMQQTQQ